MGSLPTNLGALTSPLASPNGHDRKPVDLNIHNVALGDTLFKAWYPSFYPEEIVGKDLDTLHVCRWCFKYSKELVPFLTHQKLCPGKRDDPPGELIYSKDLHAIYEVDGEEHQACPLRACLSRQTLLIDNVSE